MTIGQLAQHLFISSILYLVLMPPIFLGTTAAAQVATTGKLYGGARFGIYFSSSQKLATPFRHPQPFPQVEYWDETGQLWIYQATIPIEKEVTAKQRANLRQTFFFPDQPTALKAQPGPIAASTLFIGEVDIDGNFYALRLLEVDYKKHIHYLAVFTKPGVNWGAAIIESVKLNPNFGAAP